MNGSPFLRSDRRSPARAPRLAAAVCLVVASIAATAPSASAQETAPDWMRGLGELMNVEVTSVSKKRQRLSDTAAAVFVLTRDDIRRSGATTIPDLLRLVPGLHVAQIDGSKWAITARGFNSRWANKLLVLIDGRSIYSPHFAGVNWDAIDVPVPAVERIEVIRGPGASLWGTNAVNGVINIITAAPAVTNDTTVTMGLGSIDRVAMVNHNGRIGDRVGYRMFANGEWHGPLGTPGDTDWRQRLAGASIRATLNARDTLEGTVRGSQSRSRGTLVEVTEIVPFTRRERAYEVDSDNWFATGRWTRQLARRGVLQIESTFDQWRRGGSDLDNERSSVNLSVQNRIGILGRHDAVWGADYRRTTETTTGQFGIMLTPASFTHDMISVFGQDDMTIAGGRGNVIVGVKLEHREFTGWAVQPTARVLWRLTESQTVWSAVSRAFRAADRVDRGVLYLAEPIEVGGPLPAILTVEGNPAIDGEWLTAYEAGYRAHVGNAVTLDLAGYVNRYTGLHTFRAIDPALRSTGAGQPYVAVPLQYTNGGNGTSIGGEATITYTPAARWKLTGGYSLFSLQTAFQRDVENRTFAGAGVPRHQAQLRSSVTLPRGVELDASMLAIGAIPEQGVGGYVRADVNTGWRLSSQLDLSIALQNLTDERDIQFIEIANDVQARTVPGRSVSTRVRWRF